MKSRNTPNKLSIPLCECSDLISLREGEHPLLRLSGVLRHMTNMNPSNFTI